MRSAQFIDFACDRSPSQSSTQPAEASAELCRLRQWLNEAEEASGLPESADAPPARRRTTRGGASAETAPCLRGSTRTSAPTPLPAELVELLLGMLRRAPKLVADEPPAEFARALADAAAADAPERWAPSWDAARLSMEEQAMVLADGARLGVVDRARLTAFLGKDAEKDLRVAFFVHWVEGWLGPYLKRRPFGPEPEQETLATQMLTKGRVRGCVQGHCRKCGRLLVDGIRDLFGRVLWLQNVEQEAVVRLLESFADVLCDEADVEERFAHARVPEKERPRDVQGLAHAVFLLAYHGILLNTAVYNAAARGGSRPQSRHDFATQGRLASGFHDEFLRKMFDEIHREAL